MEFDILNELLTGTVAQLFTDLTKHKSYMKSSSQMGQDKSEIPHKKTSSTSEFLINSSLINNNGGDYSSPVKNQHSRMSSSSNGGGDGTTDSQVVAWLQIEAKLRLTDAFLKLNIDNQKVSGKHL